MSKWVGHAKFLSSLMKVTLGGPFVDQKPKLRESMKICEADEVGLHLLDSV